MTTCRMCREALDADRLPRGWRWHVECLAAAKRSALTASAAPAVLRRLRVAFAREVLARINERGAA